MADEENQLLVPGQEEVKKLFQKDAFSRALPIMAIPMIVIGHLYLFDCKVQPFIPIFLLVGGYSSILEFLIQVSMGCCWEDNTACKIVKFWSYQVSLFMTVWCIVGSVWVYGVKKVDFEDTSSVEYCNKTLYFFSWWLLTISWSILAFIIVVAILFGCCAAIISLRE